MMDNFRITERYNVPRTPEEEQHGRMMWETGMRLVAK